MRFRTSLSAFALFVLAAACDAGDSSDDTVSTTGGATGTGGATATTGGTKSTTGGTPNAGGGATIDTGKGCTPGAMVDSGVLQGPYGALHVTAGGTQYYLQVNEWNATATQVMTYGGNFFFQMTRQEASVPTNGAPTGYPSMFIGANGMRTTADSGLPKQVSALTRVPTRWDWNDAGTLADTTTNSYNVAYDVWFSTNPAGEPNEYVPSGGYLMVWLYDPPDAQPVGAVSQRGVTVAGVGGTWDVWIGNNGSRPVISYLATTPVKSMSFDMNDFIKDSVNNRPNTIQNAWYLTNVFIGFEIWRGGVNLETTRFCVDVE